MLLIVLIYFVYLSKNAVKPFYTAVKLLYTAVNLLPKSVYVLCQLMCNDFVIAILPLGNFLKHLMCNHA